MRVVFLGTPMFAAPALRILIENSYDVCAVLTQPDRPSGRGHRLQPGPIKVLAEEHGIPVYQPERIRDNDNQAILGKLQPDFLVVVAYGQILPVWLLEAARIAPVNIHASLLPQYRGAAPIPWAILNGETCTGITTMMMSEELDAGPVLLQQEVPIPIDKTADELSTVLSNVGAHLLIQTLKGLTDGTVQPIPQDETRVSWAPRIVKSMAPVSWQKRSLDIHNQIRGMNSWPVAYALFRNEHLRLWRSQPAESTESAGAIPGTLLAVTQQGICVQCGEGSILEILEVQLPAKGRITGREFANGAHLRPGEWIFG